jgi:hypothetical protein
MNYNPTYAISLFFDDDSTQILNSLINSIAEITGNFYVVENHIPPHITLGMFKGTKDTEQKLCEMEHYACPTIGSCQGLYTANTLACLTEMMGMSLEGCATASAVSSKKRRIAFFTAILVICTACIGITISIQMNKYHEEEIENQGELNNNQLYQLDQQVFKSKFINSFNNKITGKHENIKKIEEAKAIIYSNNFEEPNVSFSNTL